MSKCECSEKKRNNELKGMRCMQKEHGLQVDINAAQRQNKGRVIEKRNVARTNSKIK